MSEPREINLFELILMSWRGLKRLALRLILLSVKTIKLSFRYFWIVIPIMALVFLCGYLLTTKERTIFKANGIITFAVENRLAVINEIQSLNSMKYDEREQVKNIMSLTDEQIDNLLEIRSSFVIDYLDDSIPDMLVYKNGGHYLEDTLNRVVPDMLVVQFFMKGTTDYKPYVVGLEKFFDANQPLRTIDSVSKDNIERRIAFCDKELERLDRFSEYDYFGHSSQTATMKDWQGLKIEPSRANLYYINMRDLIRERDYLTNSLANKRGVVSFVSPQLSVFTYPRYLKLLLCAVLGFVLGVCVANIYKKHFRK